MAFLKIEMEEFVNFCSQILGHMHRLQFPYCSCCIKESQLSHNTFEKTKITKATKYLRTDIFIILKCIMLRCLLMFEVSLKKDLLSSGKELS